MNNATGRHLVALVRDGDTRTPAKRRRTAALRGVRTDPRRRVLDAGFGGDGHCRLGAGTRPGGGDPHRDRRRDRRPRPGAPPEVSVVDGDLQRDDATLAGPFDLLYSMTAVYAAPDRRPRSEARRAGCAGASSACSSMPIQQAASRRLRRRAPPGAGGRRSSRATYRDFASAGWTSVSVRDLHPEFVFWYRDRATASTRSATRSLADSAATGTSSCAVVTGILEWSVPACSATCWSRRGPP